jgi:predicted enzyme related to lactoylglutathione lyase
MNGKVVHFEVPAKNPKRAQSFYKYVFGWQMNDVPMPTGTYTLVTTAPTDKNGMLTEPGAINGGKMNMAKPFSGPVITIQVDDIDQSLEEVKKHGGKAVTKKTSMGDFGSYGYFRDSEGNFIGLFTPPSRQRIFANL